MLFLQGLSNLQVDNVASYLEPIVMEEGNEDLRFMAAWTTLALADKRAERIYEIYWPIFESRNASLELRVAAVTLLLISNPTAARLISIHRIIQTESDPHLINYYRTTVTSISETTYPCYQHLWVNKVILRAPSDLIRCWSPFHLLLISIDLSDIPLISSTLSDLVRSLWSRSISLISSELYRSLTFPLLTAVACSPTCIAICRRNRSHVTG